MEKYCYRVAGIVTEIDYEATEYKDYLDREFGLLKCTGENPDIKVTIHNKKYKGTGKCKGSFQKKSGSVVQFFKAFGRRFVIVYKSISEMELYIPYSFGDCWGRIANPYYESRAISCREDFFHNPFLFILQMNLLKRNASLFHCSSFCNGDDRCFVLAGEGHAGKTAVLKELAKKGGIRACSEDFAVVDSEGIIYGYPHQLGVKTKSMEPSSFKGFGDKLNRRIYELLTEKKNVRHFPFKDVIKGEFKESARVCGVLFLDRQEKFDCRRIDSGRASETSVKIITKEFENMVSLKELSSALFEADISDMEFAGMLKKTEDVYGNFFEKTSGMCELRLPVYEDKAFTAEKICEVCAEI